MMGPLLIVTFLGLGLSATNNLHLKVPKSDALWTRSRLLVVNDNDDVGINRYIDHDTPQPPFPWEPLVGNCDAAKEESFAGGHKVYHLITPKLDFALAARSAVTATYRWCQEFVLPNHLCPWAANSLQGPKERMRFFCVSTEGVDDYDFYETVAKDVAAQFQEQVLDKGDLLVESAAIFFLLFVGGKSDDFDFSLHDFYDFYAWYTEIEDNWYGCDDDDDGTRLGDTVTIAPFHPKWDYSDSGNTSIEKRTPVPILTFVSTSIVDRAGSDVTAQIAERNFQTLSSRTSEEWGTAWHDALWGPN